VGRASIDLIRRFAQAGSRSRTCGRRAGASSSSSPRSGDARSQGR
jgi:hypothetical protein